MDFLNEFVVFFQDGGIFMYFIALVFIVGMAIAIERVIYLQITRTQSRHLWRELSPMLKSGNYIKAMEATAQSKAMVSKVINFGLVSCRTARGREDIETAMEEGLLEAVPRLEKRIPYLATFANISTLLGLLGTVIGLIQAFESVKEANPAEKAEVLSASISIAMNTTAFGLIAAIPLLLIHTYLQSKTTELIEGLEMAVIKFTNMMMDKARAGQK